MSKTGRPIGSSLTLVEYKTRYKEILDLYDAGVPQNEIAIRFTLSRQRIHQILRYANRPLNGYISTTEKIRRLMSEGLTFDDACDQLKLSEQSKINYRRKMGLPLVYRLRKPRWLKLACTLIEARNKSAIQVANELGCDRVWVYTMIQDIRKQGFGHLLNLIDGRSVKEND